MTDFWPFYTGLINLSEEKVIFNISKNQDEVHSSLKNRTIAIDKFIQDVTYREIKKNW